jgi:hypothetical protein
MVMIHGSNPKIDAEKLDVQKLWWEHRRNPVRHLKNKNVLVISDSSPIKHGLLENL